MGVAAFRRGLRLERAGWVWTLDDSEREVAGGPVSTLRDAMSALEAAWASRPKDRAGPCAAGARGRIDLQSLLQSLRLRGPSKLLHLAAAGASQPRT